MPLTLAHPAAAVPLHKLGIPLSALVIGSMSPDFAKIFTLRPSVGLGHSLDGILWFCIPTGLVVLALFHFVIKVPVIALLPARYASRLVPLLDNNRWRDLRNLPIVCLGLALGAFTHLFWDSFTHADGWIAHHIPFLYEPVFAWKGQEVKGYKLAQHGSTIVGMTLLAVWAIGWICRAPVSENYKSIWPFSLSKPLVISLLSLAVALPAIAFGMWKAQGLSESRMIQVFAGRTAVAGMAMTYVTLLVFSSVYTLRNAKVQRVGQSRNGPL